MGPGIVETVPPTIGTAQMPRTRSHSLFPIVALSVQGASDALGLDRNGRIIREAIASGELKAYAAPSKRVRILVADLTEWVARTWPRTKHGVEQ